MAEFDSKERKNIKIMFACPNIGKIRTELVKFLLINRSKFSAIYLPQKKHNYINSNNIIKTFLNTKYTHLLSIDSDINPFPDTVSRMLNMLDQGFDVCSCVVPIFDIRFKNFKLGAGRQRKDGKWNYLKLSGKVEEVDFIGGAYWMAKRQVLEKIGPPYFDIKLKKDGSMKEGADLFFSNKIRKAGFKMCVDMTRAAGHSAEIDFIHLMK